MHFFLTPSAGRNAQLPPNPSVSTRFAELVDLSAGQNTNQTERDRSPQGFSYATSSSRLHLSPGCNSYPQEHPAHPRVTSMKPSIEVLSQCFFTHVRRKQFTNVQVWIMEFKEHPQATTSIITWKVNIKLIFC